MHYKQASKVHTASSKICTNFTENFFPLSFSQVALCIAKGSAKVLNVQFIVLFASVCRSFRFFLLHFLRKWRKRLTSDFKTNDIPSVSNSHRQGHLRSDVFYKSQGSPSTDKVTSSDSPCKISLDAPCGPFTVLDVSQLHQLSNVIKIQSQVEDESHNDTNNNSPPNESMEHSNTTKRPFRSCKLAFSFGTSWLLDHILIPALDQVPKLHVYAGFTIAIASGKLHFLYPK